MNRSEFARILQEAVVGALGEFRRHAPDESPYALAIILGQYGNDLGYAVATEEGLRRVASLYVARGWRYRGWEWEEFNEVDCLATWLRWANPDDGWRYGDFPDHFGVAPALADLVASGAFGEDAQELEEFCTEMLARLQFDTDWLAVAGTRQVVVGVTAGSDPRDFLRTATRANQYCVVRQLWEEHWRGEELCSKISAPG